MAEPRVERVHISSTQATRIGLEDVVEAVTKGVLRALEVNRQNALDNTEPLPWFIIAGGIPPLQGVGVGGVAAEASSAQGE